MTAPLDCRFVDWEREGAALRDDWDALQRKTAYSADPLLSHHWYAAWRSVFGGRIRSRVVAVRRGPALTAVLPVMIGRVRRSPSMTVRHDYMPGDHQFATARQRSRVIPVRQLSPVLGLEAATWRGGPLVDPEEEGASLEALFGFLRNQAGWDLAVFPLAANAADRMAEICRRIGIAARIDRLDRPMYRREDLPPWDVFLKSKHSHFRKRYQEAVRRAAREGLTFQTFSGRDGIEPALATVAEVAQRSWKADGREGQAVLVPYTPDSRRFFETLCTAGDGIIPVVSVIAQGDAPKAALLSIAYGKRLVTLLTFYEPSIRHISLGRLMIKMAHEWAVEHGLAEIDFNSNNPFAAIYADHHEIYHNLTLFSGSLYGRLIHAVSRSSKAAEPESVPDAGQPDSWQEANP
ncbi:MAG TPA: GNAT family N-acetyltransferase [Dongiaceae bacterium]|nr:GNAT family N-acetyltransferase [Dongiaceae bacterium]